MSLSDRAPHRDLHRLIQSVQWSVMPETGQALIRTLRDDAVDTFTLCRIIKKDPVLTATLLRMANSALFGLSGSVDTLERAVRVVGVSMVRTRALSMCMAHLCQFPPGIDRMAFWHQSLLCAGFAQWLADLCEVDDQEAWLCGLMLRLGSLSMVQAHPEHACTLESQTLDSAARWLLQRRLVGFDEGEVTAELAQQWDFPAAMVNGLCHCAQPLASKHMSQSQLPTVLHLAARLADCGTVTQQSVDALPLVLLSLLELAPQTLLDNPPDADTLADISMFSD